MNQFLDILLLASFVIGGVYSLWTAVQMRRWKELKPNKFIYPNGCEPGDCTNPEGFRAFMRPQVLLFGLLCLATAATFLAGTYLSFCPDELVWAAFALGLGRTGRLRLQKLLEQNRRLTKRLDEARVISQAKCALALYCGTPEDEAHRLIEKRAMDARVSSREIALDILKECGRGG